MNLDRRLAWRFAKWSEFRGWCAGDRQTWLSGRELRELARLQAESRRNGWLLGRFLAKQLAFEQWRSHCRGLQDIEITSHDHAGRGIRPNVTVVGRKAYCSLSISHTETAALVAISTAPGISLGVDLVRDAAASPGFLRAWFDPLERAVLGAGDARETARLWAVKEAVYKSVNRNEGFAPRRVQVRRASCGGYHCVYRGVDLADCCRIRTWCCGDHIAALAATDLAALSGETAEAI